MIWPFRRKPKWRQREVTSPDGIVFTIREAPGVEREILSRMSLKWVPESECRFSFLPMFEDWHRAQYLSALREAEE